jgi:MATE family multidrug resistance protein
MIKQQQQQQQHGHVEVGGVLPVETDTLLLAATRKIPSNENDDSITMFQDVVDILVLSGPIFLAMISWLGMKTTDTALLGHVSADALAAAALSDLWTMCTAVLIQGRVLGILVGGALGAGNPKLGGIYLQVSLVVLSGVSVIVFIAWNCTEQVWVAFGSNVDIAADAGYYARILSLSIPAQVLFGQVSQYFSAQRIMNPEVHSSLFALALNLLFGFGLSWGLEFLISMDLALRHVPLSRRSWHTFKLWYYTWYTFEFNNCTKRVGIMRGIGMKLRTRESKRFVNCISRQRWARRRTFGEWPSLVPWLPNLEKNKWQSLTPRIASCGSS